jgi:Fe-S cluster assembly protein SufD
LCEVRISWCFGHGLPGTFYFNPCRLPGGTGASAVPCGSACCKGTVLSAVEVSSASAHTEGTPGLSDGLQARSVAARLGLASVALPTDAEEVWRYSRVGEISFADFVGQAGSEDRTEVRFVEQEGLVVARGAAVRSELVGVLLPDASDAFSLASIANLVDVTSIEVAAGVTVREPIRLDRQVVSDRIIVGTRLVISVEAQGECTVIERLSSGEVASLVLPMTEIRLAQGARLRYITVQELGTSARQIAMTVCETGADASLSTMAVALGGSYARLRNDARITGKGAHNELLAVYFGEGNQMHDFRTTQDHVAPKSTSELVFKGAVKDSSRSVYSGLIRIGEHARGTVANQTNRNLLLSPNAAAESVPNLEIENNDVKCSHASAVGPIDEDHRYYLESRGVPSEVAERLIVLGFFAELLERIPDLELRAELSASVTAKFDRRVLSGAGVRS